MRSERPELKTNQCVKNRPAVASAFNMSVISRCSFEFELLGFRFWFVVLVSLSRVSLCVSPRLLWASPLADPNAYVRTGRLGLPRCLFVSALGWWWWGWLVVSAVLSLSCLLPSLCSLAPPVSLPAWLWLGLAGAFVWSCLVGVPPRAWRGLALVAFRDLFSWQALLFSDFCFSRHVSV